MTTALRTHRCGDLRATDVGATVALCGWIARRRDHGGVAFLDLRDASGVVQVVINDEAVAHPLRSEFCLRVVGEVRRRPEGNDNPALPTGDIEVEIFNRKIWDLPTDELLSTVAERYSALVLPYLR